VFRVEGVDRPHEQNAPNPARVVVQSFGIHAIAAVPGRAAVDLLRRGEGLPPLHQLGDEGITALGQLSRSPLGRHHEGVPIHPVEPVLAFRKAEAALDEAPGLGVVLAHEHRVLAAVRQADEAVAFVGLQARVALEDPVAPLRLG
jgi:hypothetical protein